MPVVRTSVASCNVSSRLGVGIFEVGVNSLHLGAIRRFRHGGPKPQSREAAILMMADSVEASVRSLAAPDESAIRAMVRRIIDERLDDGQFDECDLTLRDLERIRETFVAQLLGMYHRRIEYPQNKIVELESRRSESEAKERAG